MCYPSSETYSEIVQGWSLITGSVWYGVSESALPDCRPEVAAA